MKGLGVGLGVGLACGAWGCRQQNSESADAETQSLASLKGATSLVVESPDTWLKTSAEKMASTLSADQKCLVRKGVRLTLEKPIGSGKQGHAEVFLTASSAAKDGCGREHWFIYAPHFVKGDRGSTSLTAQRLRELGLVDVGQGIPSVKVALAYATAENFLGRNVYGDLDRCFLQKEAEAKLKAADEMLRRDHPGYALKLRDCARPLAVQRAMWALVKGTSQEKYVADPDNGASVHNFGAAVDVVLLKEGKELDMGTPFDSFSPLSEPRREKEFLAAGKLTEDQVNHRLILRDVMVGGGFTINQIEWWHFDAYPKAVAREKYQIIP